jgi:hypothetical protein
MDKHVKQLIEQFSGSSEYIKQSGIKNRYLHPYIPTIVIDNFYEEPDLWREYALSQEFYKGDRGSWPGLRTKLLHELDQDIFRVTLRKLLMVMAQYGYSEFLELQTGFQMIDGTYGRGWVHDDDPKLNIAGVIYLNKEAPLGSGTTIYKDQNDFNGDKYTEMFMDDVLIASPEDRAKYEKYREEQVAHFQKTVTVESVYNRLIIFDTRNWHSAEKFFGDSVDSARLTQVIFGKIR